MIENNTKKTILTPEDRLNNRPKREPLKDVRLEDIIGSIQVVEAVPTGIPKTFWDSIKIFDDTGTYYLYVYANGIGWISTTLT